MRFRLVLNQGGKNPPVTARRYNFTPPRCLSSGPLLPPPRSAPIDAPALPFLTSHHRSQATPPRCADRREISFNDHPRLSIRFGHLPRASTRGATSSLDDRCPAWWGRGPPRVPGAGGGTDAVGGAFGGERPGGVFNLNVRVKTTLTGFPAPQPHTTTYDWAAVRAPPGERPPGGPRRRGRPRIIFMPFLVLQNFLLFGFFLIRKIS